MSGIKRWDIAALGNGFTGMKQTDDGAFVRNADHEAEVARLRADLEGYMMGAAAEAREVDDRGEEIKRLRAELADAHAAIESKAGWEWKKEADRLRAEVEAYRKDAERYRWLRDTPWFDNYEIRSVIAHQQNALWDETIDAAMGASA